MQICNCEYCSNKTQCTVMRVEIQNSVKICRNSKFVEIQNLSKYTILSKLSKFKICRKQNLSKYKILSKFVEIQNLSKFKIC